jgi:hypothetical protein
VHSFKRIKKANNWDDDLALDHLKCNLRGIAGDWLRRYEKVATNSAKPSKNRSPSSSSSSTSQTSSSSSSSDSDKKSSRKNKKYKTAKKNKKGNSRLVQLEQKIAALHIPQNMIPPAPARNLFRHPSMPINHNLYIM